MPVCIKKTRQNENPKLGSDLIRTEGVLAAIISGIVPSGASIIRSLPGNPVAPPAMPPRIACAARDESY
jgi:hypothetical protein